MMFLPRRLYLLLFVSLILAVPGSAQAQDGAEETIRAAEAAYSEGTLIDPNVLLTISVADLPAAEAVRVYRLLALYALLQNDSQEARLNIFRLLAREPAYVADSLYDPPVYVDAVREVRGSLFIVSDSFVSCRSALDEAQARYYEGVFGPAADDLETCVDRNGSRLGEEEAIAALKLIALMRLKTADLGRARSAAARLFALQPNFTADPVLDPPDFVRLMSLVALSHTAAQ